MSFKDTIIADLKAIANDLDNQVFTYKGQEYNCIPSSKGDIASLELGGLSLDADLSLTVLKEEFTDNIYPISQQKITYKNRGYRIQTVRQDVTDAFLRLICIDDTKGI